VLLTHRNCALQICGAACDAEEAVAATPVSIRPNQFESVDDIPNTMKRHETWQLAYKRNPLLERTDG